jgi:carbonic anhydrase/acetyltransferase-like protein (isoleucine patch superfamily)
MAIYALGADRPEISPHAYVHPEATIIGRVVIGPESSVWPQAVLRGDFGAIVIGAGTNVQDGTVVHATDRNATRIGDDCVIGHLVQLEGCVIEDGALIGSNAVVLQGAVVGAGALVGAGTLVPTGFVVPPAAVALGVPAAVRQQPPRADLIRINTARYRTMANRYRTELVRLD